MYLNFDTETTGLPVYGAPSDDPRHPRVVSVSAFLDDEHGKPIKEMSVIIKPPAGFRYEDFPEAFRVHGITTERAMDVGIELLAAAEEFAALNRLCKIISSFNLFFDFKMMKIACALIGPGDSIRAELEAKQGICSMESAGMHLTGKKRISLKNAYWELFKEETQTAAHHDSRPDAVAARRIFFELLRRNALLPPKPMERKNYGQANPDPPVGKSVEVEL